MRLSGFIAENTAQIVAEWAEFARVVLPDGDLEQRRDHIAGMLCAIARDLECPQTLREQSTKSKGGGDSDIDADTAANAHGVDRAASGSTPGEMLAEFRALRASVLKLWTAANLDVTRDSLDDMTRFNEAIDQLLAESIATYGKDVDRSKDLFLGVLGHDLRTPLGAILMSATLVSSQEAAEWPHQRTMARVLRACTRMDGMISDLLDFTRTRLGAGMAVVPEEMDLQVVCRQTIDEITAFHPGCAIRLSATGSLKGAWDAARIGQVLSNLIGNAQQHGTKDMTIDVTLRGDADPVVLTVHNQGKTIERHRLRDIFNPFQQGAAPDGTAADPQSVGLGLYIVQAIVTAHRGTIEVDSGGQGTTFTVRLPRG
jgi:signal transduction histidine kinase